MSESAEKTDPQLWERVKEEVTAGDKGGHAGQWSARKAQLAVLEYKKHGGGFAGPPDPDNSLHRWSEEAWGTKSGGNSTDTGERYLPKAAREALSDEEYRRSTAAKRRDTRQGKQFSAQPPDVARKAAKYRDGPKSEPSRAELYEMARKRELPGRSAMTKAQLAQALGKA